MDVGVLLIGQLRGPIRALLHAGASGHAFKHRLELAQLLRQEHVLASGLRVAQTGNERADAVASRFRIQDRGAGGRPADLAVERRLEQGLQFGTEAFLFRRRPVASARVVSAHFIPASGEPLLDVIRH